MQTTIKEKLNELHLPAPHLLRHCVTPWFNLHLKLGPMVKIPKLLRFFPPQVSFTKLTWKVTWFLKLSYINKLILISCLVISLCNEKYKFWCCYISVYMCSMIRLLNEVNDYEKLENITKRMNDWRNWIKSTTWIWYAYARRQL